MVGGVCVMGCSSMVVDSKKCSCNFNGGDLILQRHHYHHDFGRRNKQLKTSFLHNPLISTPNYFLKRKQRRKKGLHVLLNQRPTTQDEDNFDDVKKQILDYFTYKAVRTVMNQLYEMNPTQYRWFYDYVVSNEHGYGKAFIRNLVKDKQELAERVMVTRLHLYERWTNKFCDHAKMYERISDQNLELMRERLQETVIWPSDDTNTEVVE